MKITQEDISRIRVYIEEALQPWKTNYPKNMTLDATKRIVTEKVEWAFKANLGDIPALSIIANWDSEQGDYYAQSLSGAVNSCISCSVSVLTTDTHIGNGYKFCYSINIYGFGANSKMQSVDDVEVADYHDLWRNRFVVVPKNN